MRRSSLKRRGRRATKEGPALRAFIDTVRKRCRAANDWYICEVCSGLTRVIEAHHVRPRSLGGEHDGRHPARGGNGLGCCSGCHNWIGSHIEQAKALGYYK